MAPRPTDPREYRDRAVLDALLRDIALRTERLPRPVRIMEVCGTHTMALYRTGLSARLAEAGILMVSGPGCPVCVTPNGVHEAAIRLVTERPSTTLLAFGDMTRVPTTIGSLQTSVPAAGSRLKVVFSPQEALDAARREPDRQVVFYGAGFETTTPGIAATVKRARAEGLRNFSVLSAFWLIPPPLRAILESGDVRISGFLYPGHVSAILGVHPYEFVPREFGVPGAIAGFEPADLLLGIRAIVDQAVAKAPAVALEYARAVRPEGNPAARALMDEVLEPWDALWRGLGRIPASGLKLRPDYADYDAEKKLGLRIVDEDAGDLAGCRCGEVLRGVITPEECPLYGRVCRPESPRGPCMVSFEGACLVHLKYGDETTGGLP